MRLALFLRVFEVHSKGSCTFRTCTTITRLESDLERNGNLAQKFRILYTKHQFLLDKIDPKKFFSTKISTPFPITFK
jgi:hypothetical protein